jgi:hypothetical protein
MKFSALIRIIASLLMLTVAEECFQTKVEDKKRGCKQFYTG